MNKRKTSKEREPVLRGSQSSADSSLPHRAEHTPLIALILFALIITTSLGFAVLTYVMNYSSQSVYDAVQDSNEAYFLTLLWQVPIVIFSVAFTNSLTIFFGQHLSTVWRKNIADYIFERYFTGNVFYNMNIIDSSTVDNIDQRISTDLRYYCDNLCAFLFGTTAYFGLIPNLFATFAFTVAIALHSGWIGVLIGWGSFVIFAVLNTVLTSWMTGIRVQQETRESNFRYMNTHVRTHSEHVSFFRGQDEEKAKLNSALDAIFFKQRSVITRSLPLNTSAIMYSYMNQILAYAIPGLLYFYGPASFRKLSGASFMATMLSNKFLQDFLGYLVGLSQVWTDTVPYVSRVGQLIEQLDIHYEFEIRGLSSKAHLKHGENIVFEHVDGYTPLKTLLIKDLSFEVEPNKNLIIMGTSGKGKSSILRYLAGLWPIANGSITRPDTPLRSSTKRISRDFDMELDQYVPDSPDIFYLPQTPYIVLGSLREQIMYPTKITDAASIISDAHLVELLTKVGLQYLLPRIKSPDVVMDWEHMLSVGEQQRIAMARVFYNRPKYAILDEATSAVESDVEAAFYRNCIQLGITFISVAHRHDVIRFHHQMLFIEGDGRWRLLPVTYNPEPPKHPVELATSSTFQ